LTKSQFTVIIDVQEKAEFEYVEEDMALNSPQDEIAPLVTPKTGLVVPLGSHQ